MTLRFSPPRGSARWFAVLFLPALLAACAGSEVGSMLSPASAPSAQTDAPATAPAPAAPAAPAVAARAAPAGRSAQGAPVPQATSQSLTPEQINGECWLSIESNKKVRDLDQRLKLVNKCVEERTKDR
jgi:hypothetical protein